MGKVKIPYYVVVKGRGYWRPHPRMRRYGFQIVRCGADGPEAWALAADWNSAGKLFAKARLLPQSISTSSHATPLRPRGAILPDQSGLPFKSIFALPSGTRALFLRGSKFGGRHGFGFGTCGVMWRRTRSRSR